jgi:hypothetical protein
MKIGIIIGIAVLILFAAVAVFHAIHHFLYCRYREVPGRSHCAVCGHRRICEKYHHRRDF